MERLNGGGILINMVNEVLGTDDNRNITDSEVLKSLLEIYPIVRDGSYKNNIFLKVRIMDVDYAPDTFKVTIIPCSYELSKNKIVIHGSVVAFDLTNAFTIQLTVNYTINDCDEVVISSAYYSLENYTLGSPIVYAINIYPVENQEHIHLYVPAILGFSSLKENEHLPKVRLTAIARMITYSFTQLLVYSATQMYRILKAELNSSEDGIDITYFNADGTTSVYSTGDLFEKITISKVH